MKKIHCLTLSAALAAVGLAGCDALTPEETALSPTAQEEGVPPLAPAAPTPIERVAVAEGETLAAVVRDPDPYARARRLGTLLPSLGPEAIPQVRRIFRDPALDLAAADMELLVRYWANYEPENAARWAVARSPHGYRIIAILAAFTRWAEEDPRAAMRASEERVAKIADAREAVMIALVRGWFRKNPEELTQYIRELGMGMARQKALSTMIREMIRTGGPDAAISWAESLPGDDETYKTAVYRQVGAALPLFDHDAGIRWCDVHCDGPYGSGLRGIISRRWVRTDAPAALAWLSTAPESHERDLSVRAGFSVWGQSDREAALAWMAEQTAQGLPEWLRPVIPVYARLLADDSPQEAVEWAMQIAGDEEREVVLTGVARKWLRQDEAAAEAWLSQSPLSEEARQKARSPHEGPPTL